MEKRVVMFHPFVSEDAVRRVVATLRARWIGEGPTVRRFEETLCRQFGFRHVLALNSGTAGLHLALVLAGVGPGDEVITTAMTCTATNMPILQCYARPVFADVQLWTGNIDPADIEHRITQATKAIVVVHWGGYPCDLDEIHEIAAGYGLPVIEDAAHALGASYRGYPIGTISQFTMFSLQAIKQLTTGDGGLLATLNRETHDAARLRRWFGIDRENRTASKVWPGYQEWSQEAVGYKYHMNDIAASIGLGNLEGLPERLARRAWIVDAYRDGLANVPGVTLFDRNDDRQSGDWLFTLHVENRWDFHRAMADRGIETSVCHIRNDLHPVFGPRREDLPNLDQYQKSYICIPLHDHLSDADVARVIEAVRAGW